MLKQRVITAVFLLGFFLAALFWLPPSGWLILASLVGGVAGWEWGGLVRLAGMARALFALLMLLACAGLGFVAGLAHAGPPASPVLVVVYGASAVFWLGLAPFWLRHRWPLGSPLAALALGVVVILPPALALAHLRQIDPMLLLFAMSLVWIADIAAYFTGRAFGRHKLAPAISPGKTWEGAAGAVAGVLVFGLAVAVLSGHAPPDTVRWLLVSVLLLVLTAISIIGDLFESLIKRQAGVKDSGAILPGHGGLLDRIDSLTSTLPVIGLMAIWV